MSVVTCSNATAPVNIDANKVTNTCSLKCELSFSYNNSNCVAKNMGTYISLKYDKNKTPPVTFNLASYDVAEIRIYCPSLHTYNGYPADGEMIIIHNSNAGKPPLFICVPIKKGSATTNAATALSTIVNDIKNNAPSSSDNEVAVTIKKFNLNDFVPRKPFYTYVATEPFLPCSTTNNNYVVFTPSNGFIDISDADYSVLTKIVGKHTYITKQITDKSNNQLAFNQTGPVIMKNDGQIYIDCQPVGQSDETEVVVNNISGTKAISAADTLNNPFVQFFLGSIVFILFILGIYKLIDVFKMSKPSMIGGGPNSGSFLYGLKNIII